MPLLACTIRRLTEAQKLDMRTSESFEKHKTKTISNCQKSWLILYKSTLLGDEYLVTPHQCKSNYCPDCRARNLRAIRKGLYNTLASERWRLVTLTLPDHSLNLLETLCHIRKMFNNFTHRIRRQYPDFKFIRAIEVHQSGFPHIHLVVNKFIPKSFISKSWHDCGGGYTDIRVMRKCGICGGSLPCASHPGNHKFNFKHAARYLTEEIEKKFQDPHKLGVTFWQSGLKPITCSRNIKLSSAKSEWEFKSATKDPEDAYYLLSWLQYKAKLGENPQPTIHSFDNDRAFILGYGFTQKGK